MNLDRDQARDFLSRLHADLDGFTAYLAKRGKTVRRFYAPAGTVPSALTEKLPGLGWNLWVSVATFRSKRESADALTVRALWADLDSPKDLDPEALDEWKDAAWNRLRTLDPTLAVDSGRGLHGYWILPEPVRFDGEDGDRLRALVEACNRAVAERLDGDHVGDLARVMRLPGTVNPKNGVPCRVIYADGPARGLLELAAVLDVNPDAPTRKRAVDADLPRQDSPIRERRKRGRPSYGVTVRDLRTLRPWARTLVREGGQSNLRRYGKPGTLTADRSRVDLAVVGEMVRAGWPEDRIVRAFTRPDWKIGDRFKELWDAEGWDRAVGYLFRTVERAKHGKLLAERD